MKSRSKKLLIASFFLYLFSESIHAQDNPFVTWSLDSCITYARENNIQILKNQLLMDEAEINLKEAKAAFFPSLTFASSQQYAHENSGTEKNSYAGSYGLDASMTLYNGGRNVNTVRKQKLGIENALSNYRAIGNSVEIAIIKAYYQILYAHASVETNRGIVETSLKELERSGKLLKAGTISKVDLAQVESQYNSEVYQLVVSETAEKEAILNLKQLLELDLNESFTPRFTASEEVLPAIPDRDEVVEIALATLPELKAAQSEIEMARLSKSIAKGERLPTVSLGGSVGTGHTTRSDYNLGRQLDSGRNERVGISVSVPIYSNRQIKSKIERSDLQIIDTQLSLQNSVKEVSNTIATLHLDAVSAQSRLKAAAVQLLSAEESYELMLQKYNLGMQSAVDLLVEKNNLLSAIQNKIQAQYTLLLNIRLLEFYRNQHPN